MTESTAGRERLREALERVLALFGGSYTYAESKAAIEQARAALAHEGTSASYGRRSDRPSGSVELDDIRQRIEAMRPWPEGEALLQSLTRYADTVAVAHPGSSDPARDCTIAKMGGVPCGSSDPEARPEIVVLCGSTRFYDDFQQANYDHTMAGRIVLSVGFYPHAKATHGHGEGIGHDSDEKIALDELHKRKIDLADWVYVLNRDGYIGESTRSEIDYAEDIGKPVRYAFDTDGVGSLDGWDRPDHLFTNEWLARTRP